jgi:hypothetical protein
VNSSSSLQEPIAATCKHGKYSLVSKRAVIFFLAKLVTFGSSGKAVHGLVVC